MSPLKTTLDPHVGTHPVTGLSMYELRDVITEVESDAPEGLGWWEDLHRANVELASLSREARERAQAWLDARSETIDSADMADWLRRAIAATSTEGA